MERYKTVAVDMEEEKNRERKERIDTIFMYESRIKGTLQSFIDQGTTDWLDSDLEIIGNFRKLPKFPICYGIESH